MSVFVFVKMCYILFGLDNVGGEGAEVGVGDKWVVFLFFFKGLEDGEIGSWGWLMFSLG